MNINLFYTFLYNFLQFFNNNYLNSYKLFIIIQHHVRLYKKFHKLKANTIIERLLNKGNIITITVYSSRRPITKLWMEVAKITHPTKQVPLWPKQAIPNDPRNIIIQNRPTRRTTGLAIDNDWLTWVYRNNWWHKHLIIVIIIPQLSSVHNIWLILSHS